MVKVHLQSPLELSPWNLAARCFSTNIFSLGMRRCTLGLWSPPLSRLQRAGVCEGLRECPCDSEACPGIQPQLIVTGFAVWPSSFPEGSWRGLWSGLCLVLHNVCAGFSLWLIALPSSQNQTCVTCSARHALWSIPGFQPPLLETAAYFVVGVGAGRKD